VPSAHFPFSCAHEDDDLLLLLLDDLRTRTGRRVVIHVVGVPSTAAAAATAG